MWQKKHEVGTSVTKGWDQHPGFLLLEAGLWISSVRITQELVRSVESQDPP